MSSSIFAKSRVFSEGVNECLLSRIMMKLESAKKSPNVVKYITERWKPEAAITVGRRLAVKIPPRAAKVWPIPVRSGK